MVLNWIQARGYFGELVGFLIGWETWDVMIGSKVDGVLLVGWIEGTKVLVGTFDGCVVGFIEDANEGVDGVDVGKTVGDPNGIYEVPAV